MAWQFPYKLPAPLHGSNFGGPVDVKDHGVCATPEAITSCSHAGSSDWDLVSKFKDAASHGLIVGLKLTLLQCSTRAILKNVAFPSTCFRSKRVFLSSMLCQRLCDC